jgi:hypothetical protein
MEQSENILCPYCGQSFPLSVDTSQPAQHLTVDCEICCRPMEVSIRCEDGEVLDLEVLGD